MKTGLSLFERLDQLKETFIELGAWSARYQYMAEMGKSLSPMPTVMRVDENLVQGCVAKVWLSAEFREGCLFFFGDSEAVMPKGLVALVVDFFSGASPVEILEFNVDLFKELGIATHLTPTRVVAAASMLRRVRFLAQSGGAG